MCQRAACAPIFRHNNRNGSSAVDHGVAGVLDHGSSRKTGSLATKTPRNTHFSPPTGHCSKRGAFQPHRGGNHSLQSSAAAAAGECTPTGSIRRRVLGLPEGAGLNIQESGIGSPDATHYSSLARPGARRPLRRCRTMESPGQRNCRTAPQWRTAYSIRAGQGQGGAESDSVPVRRPQYGRQGAGRDHAACHCRVHL